MLYAYTYFQTVMPRSILEHSIWSRIFDVILPNSYAVSFRYVVDYFGNVYVDSIE